MSRLTRSVGFALVGLAMVAGPFAGSASAGVIDYGAISDCRYKVTASGPDGWTEALLKRIEVEPPTIAKPAGTQSVGWRFSVRRSLDWDNGPWKTTYRSPIQRGHSSTDLSPLSVGVAVPNVENRSPIYYLVVIKMFRYDAGGSLISTTSHAMDDMHVIVDGEEIIDSYCQGLAQQWFD